jgi:hypothetical protein
MQRSASSTPATQWVNVRGSSGGFILERKSVADVQRVKEAAGAADALAKAQFFCGLRAGDSVDAMGPDPAADGEMHFFHGIVISTSGIGDWREVLVKRCTGLRGRPRQSWVLMWDLREHVPSLTDNPEDIKEAATEAAGGSPGEGLVWAPDSVLRERLKAKLRAEGLLIEDNPEDIKEAATKAAALARSVFEHGLYPGQHVDAVFPEQTIDGSFHFFPAIVTGLSGDDTSTYNSSRVMVQLKWPNARGAPTKGDVPLRDVREQVPGRTGNSLAEGWSVEGWSSEQ